MLNMLGVSFERRKQSYLSMGSRLRGNDVRKPTGSAKTGSVTIKCG
jgi:hypothetical protein